MALALPCLFYSKASPQSITISTYELHIELQQYIVVLSYGKDSCGRFHRGRAPYYLHHRFTLKKFANSIFHVISFIICMKGEICLALPSLWSIDALYTTLQESFLKTISRKSKCQNWVWKCTMVEHNIMLLHTFERLLCKHLTSHQEAPWVWPKFVPISRNPIVQ